MMRSLLHEQVTETLRSYDTSIKETMNETLRTVLSEMLESRGYAASSLSVLYSGALASSSSSKSPGACRAF